MAKTLPSEALIDTGVIIRALGERPSDPDSPACIYFVNQMEAQKRQLSYAAPSLAEMIRFDTTKPPPNVSAMMPLALDKRAAEILGNNSEDAISKGRQVRGERVGRAKLTAGQVTLIRMGYANGHSTRNLAAQYGVSKTTVHHIVNRRLWAHVIACLLAISTAACTTLPPPECQLGSFLARVDTDAAASGRGGASVGVLPLGGNGKGDGAGKASRSIDWTCRPFCVGGQLLFAERGEGRESVRCLAPVTAAPPAGPAAPAGPGPAGPRP